MSLFFLSQNQQQISFFLHHHHYCQCKQREKNKEISQTFNPHKKREKIVEEFTQIFYPLSKHSHWEKIFFLLFEFDFPDEWCLEEDLEARKKWCSVCCVENLFKILSDSSLHFFAFLSPLSNQTAVLRTTKKKFVISIS